jgi:lipopolysaccharide/colanic/teichoic acid biosynthesis glycosyltransferase
MNSLYNNSIKRVLDFLFSLFLLIVFLPILVIISILIKFKLGSPILFTHTRPGLNGKPFKMIKFRTMTNGKDDQGNLLTNHRRRTKFGDFLRKASIDELPELINVLKGDMSIVGPRPLELRYMEYYTEYQNQRHNVKPGITGWAQVNGRNTISWEEKFEHDIWYVNNISFFLDLKIIVLTVFKVLSRKGVDADEKNTVIPFDVYLKNKTNKSLIKNNLL